jgi:hypothetical protein
MPGLYTDRWCSGSAASASAHALPTSALVHGVAGSAMKSTFRPTGQEYKASIMPYCTLAHTTAVLVASRGAHANPPAVNIRNRTPHTHHARLSFCSKKQNSRPGCPGETRMAGQRSRCLHTAVGQVKANARSQNCSRALPQSRRKLPATTDGGERKLFCRSRKQTLLARGANMSNFCRLLTLSTCKARSKSRKAH